MINGSHINLAFSKGCISLHGTQEGRKTKLPFTIIYTVLIPFIVATNILAIVGIIKTKRNKFTVSEILFIVLFLNDLSFGAIKLPVQIFLIWKVTDPTCILTQIIAFYLIFPICMSGATLCIISIDRYLCVAKAKYYKKIVTKKALTLTIILLVAVSVTLSLLHALFVKTTDLSKLTKFYVSLSVYQGIFLILCVLFNVALLRNVKSKTKTSSLTQTTLNTSLSKTIALIVAAMVVTYIPLIITLNIAAYMISTDRTLAQKIALDLQWSLVPSYFNSTLNSVIYMTKSFPIKQFYGKLIKCQRRSKKSDNIGAIVNIDPLK